MVNKTKKFLEEWIDNDSKLIAQHLYINSLSHKIKMSQHYLISKGNWVGLAPIGYKNVRYPSGKADIVVDTIQSAIIKKLFNAFATGHYSIKTLTKLAHTLELKSRKGTPVSERCINDMLKNRFYVGQMMWKGSLYPHKYQTIIDKPLFGKVQTVLREHLC